MENNIENLTKSFDSTADVYDLETETFHHKISEHLTVSNLLLELPEDRNIKLLDAGGGTGKYSIILNEYGYSPELIDISSKSIDVAKRKAEQMGINLKAQVGDLGATPYMDDEFDFIMMNGGVISYTPDPIKLLKEVFRILKPSGRLFFDFPNTLGWAIETGDNDLKLELSTAAERLVRMPDWDYPARLFSLRRMEEMLLEAGFNVKSRYGLIFLSNSLSLKERYSKTWDPEILEMYKISELEISRRLDCTGASWGCCICAEKKKEE